MSESGQMIVDLFADLARARYGEGILPRARTSDPETSHEAAASVGDPTQNQTEVLEVLAEFPEGATDSELAAEYAEQVAEGLRPAQSPSGLRTRRAELVALGRVVHDGYGKSDSGRRARKWRAS